MSHRVFTICSTDLFHLTAPHQQAELQTLSLGQTLNIPWPDHISFSISLLTSPIWGLFFCLESLSPLNLGLSAHDSAHPLPTLALIASPCAHMAPIFHLLELPRLYSNCLFLISLKTSQLSQPVSWCLLTSWCSMNIWWKNRCLSCVLHQSSAILSSPQLFQIHPLLGHSSQCQKEGSFLPRISKLQKDKQGGCGRGRASGKGCRLSLVDQEVATTKELNLIFQMSVFQRAQNPAMLREGILDHWWDQSSGHPTDLWDSLPASLGLSFLICKMSVCASFSVLSDSLRPHGL